MTELTDAASRELAVPVRSSEEDHAASSRAGFDEVVRPVELADGGRPLHGQGRADCEQAYAAYPSGFVLAVAEALTGTTVNSRRAVLVSLVRKGWHVRAQELACLVAGEAPGVPATRASARFGRGMTARQVIDQTRGLR